MRICLVTHGFPPVERTGVENYTEALARALARAGQRVEVFVPRRDPLLADTSLRREEHDGWAVNWVTSNRPTGGPREMLLVPELRPAFEAFLERERPEVVHFQHLIKLGVELVEAAEARGIPTLYTVHDYYPICHRYTLLRPDLQHCTARGDSAACARCDVALGYLNTLGRLGDYHMGALPQQLAPAERETLAAILRDPPPKGEHELRSELDDLRARAYRRFERVLVPSRYLAEELVKGGFARERIRIHPYGFDNADLEALPPPRREPGRPVRLAFLGGPTKHKGVHVLLEAFARLRSGVELSLWGDSTDRPYVELLKQRSAEVGALWRGPYERPELPRIMADIDAVVVPSIWVENYPLVIREAFSAHRPVLTSRFGALPESVRDGVDGLLFAPGDPADLARVVRRLVDEPELLGRLVAGIPAVARIDGHARELVALYAELARGAREREHDPKLPPSLLQAHGRYLELGALPARELFARVLTGLEELRTAWKEELGGQDAAALIAQGLGAGSEAQDRLREARAEIAWLRSKREVFDEGREELVTLFEDVDRLLGEARSDTRAAAQGVVRQKEQELSDAQGRLGELERALRAQDERMKAVEDELGRAGRYIRHKEQEFRQAEAELARAAQLVESKEYELEVARSALRAETEQARLAREGARGAAELGREAVSAMERLLRLELLGPLASLHRLFNPDGEPNPPAAGARFLELLGVLGELRRGVDAVEKELAWRRGQHEELEWRRREMSKVGARATSGLPGLLLGWTSIGKKFASWRARDPGGGT